MRTCAPQLESSLHLPQLEKACAQQLIPNAAKNKINKTHSRPPLFLPLHPHLQFLSSHKESPPPWTCPLWSQRLAPGPVPFSVCRPALTAAPSPLLQIPPSPGSRIPGFYPPSILFQEHLGSASTLQSSAKYICSGCCSCPCSTKGEGDIEAQRG